MCFDVCQVHCAAVSLTCGLPAAALPLVGQVQDKLQRPWPAIGQRGSFNASLQRQKERGRVRAYANKRERESKRRSESIRVRVKGREWQVNEVQ